jgi:hypothetical protein
MEEVVRQVESEYEDKLDSVEVSHRTCFLFTTNRASCSTLVSRGASTLHLQLTSYRLKPRRPLLKSS